MSTHKHFDRICCIILAVVLVLSVLFMSGEAFGIQPASRVMGYESRLFDYTRVHTIDIVADDWDGFLQTCTDEEYITCAAVIDGEAYRNIAIRAKGNTSLSSVKNYGNDRYSFKLEFDHYDSSLTYHGLDKLCLNNIIQDNTYMKDFIVYQMMLKAGVSAPLCSFAYITVNGEDWGLYLAVEAVEDSFLQRNYGSDYGELYKPDSMSFGGGRGNGRDFDMDRFREDNSDIFGGDAAAENSTENATGSQFGGMAPPEMPDGMAIPEMGEEGAVPEMPDGASAPDNTMQQGGFRPDKGGMGRGDKGGMGGMGSMGSSDVKLQYTDDDPDSYTNIFSSAKTDVTDADEQRLIAALRSLSEGDTSSVFTEDVISYFVVHLFVCNGDSYTGNMIHNYYLYEDEGQLAMLPWDYNLAFGAFDGNDASSAVNAPIDTPVSGGIGEDRPMISWIFSDDAYLQQYHEFYSSFLSEVIDSGWADELISDTAELIAPYVEKDPTKFCTYEEFTKGIEALRSFIALRAQSVRGQLDGSIPSTTEGQNGSTALVDASSVNISDMGSMGKMGGHDNMDNMGDFGGFGGNGGRPSREEQDDTAPLSPGEGAEVGQQESAESDIPQDDVAQNGAAPDTPQDGFGGQTPPDMPQGGFGGQTPPDMPQGGFGGQTPPDMPQGGFGGQMPPDMQGNTVIA